MCSSGRITQTTTRVFVLGSMSLALSESSDRFVMCQRKRSFPKKLTCLTRSSCGNCSAPSTKGGKARTNGACLLNSKMPYGTKTQDGTYISQTSDENSFCEKYCWVPRTATMRPKLVTLSADTPAPKQKK